MGVEDEEVRRLVFAKRSGAEMRRRPTVKGIAKGKRIFTRRDAVNFSATWQAKDIRKRTAIGLRR
jgi:hypothetical protein